MGKRASFHEKLQVGATASCTLAAGHSPSLSRRLNGYAFAVKKFPRLPNLETLGGESNISGKYRWTSLGFVEARFETTSISSPARYLRKFSFNGRPGAVWFVPSATLIVPQIVSRKANAGGYCYVLPAL